MSNQDNVNVLIVDLLFLIGSLLGFFIQLHILKRDKLAIYPSKKLRLWNYLFLGSASAMIALISSLALVYQITLNTFSLLCMLLAVLPLLSINAIFLLITPPYICLLVAAIVSNQTLDSYFMGSIYYCLCIFISQTLYKAYLQKSFTNYQLIEENCGLLNRLQTDRLTGALNRYGFDEKIKILQPYLKRANTPFCVYMADIDHFKKYNDYFGHLEGDECLKKIARALMSEIHQDSDFVCRFGGEEFLIFLYNIEGEDAKKSAERFCNKVRDLKIVTAPTVNTEYVTISIGGCIGYWQKEKDVIRMTDEADQALYIAKKKGRDGYVIKKHCPKQKESNK